MTWLCTSVRYHNISKRIICRIPHNSLDLRYDNLKNKAFLLGYLVCDVTRLLLLFKNRTVFVIAHMADLRNYMFASQ